MPAPKGLRNTRRDAASGPRNALTTAMEDKEKTYLFPGNLNSHDQWMAIRIVDRKFRSFVNTGDADIKRDIAKIYLPMPLQLATQYDQSYNADGLGLIGAGIASGSSKVSAASIKNQIENFDAATAQGTAVKALDKATSLEGLKQGFEIAKEAAGAGVVNVLANSARGKAALAAQGFARNPFMALAYDSPQFREHAFSWKFVAKNYRESVTLLEIIQLLKYHAAPSRAGKGFSSFYKYPEQFDIDFNNEGFLFNIAPSILKSIAVNYHPDGPYYHLPENSDEDEDDLGITVDKAPVSIQLDLSFQEASILTKNEYNKHRR